MSTVLPADVESIPILTTELLARFKNGRLEIQSVQHKTIHCGEIKDITVRASLLEARFTWIALARGYPVPHGWYAIRNEHAYITNIGLVQPLNKSGGRIVLNNTHRLETAILYPADYPTLLQPYAVEGLKIV